ncbi:MAG: 23S rRNA (pseudouridine(1915)-N(3))-methyltransferase RlmH [Trueperaceae bacterium]|nr:MAG: 23S rRNA (pseudouridine(1915)-N(3))-methyltransferase RlmH [Trueperaceae bacterium]
MRYRLIAIGQLKRGFYAEACRHYQKRLQALAKLELLELKEGKGSAQEVQASESRALLRAANGYLIALDERGWQGGSRELAARIGALENRGVSQICLLVGGAEGHHPTLLSEVDERWSLSELTLPHELARLVLLEQLYRAETIRAGHPYHRG